MRPVELDAARAALRRDLTIDIRHPRRRSGEWRTTEIWFVIVDDTVYICGTPGAGPAERGVLASRLDGEPDRSP